MRWEKPGSPNGIQPSNPSPATPQVTRKPRAAQAEKHRKADRERAAGALEHARGDFRVDARDDAEHPKGEREYQDAEDDGGHIKDSLACA